MKSFNRDSDNRRQTFMKKYIMMVLLICCSSCVTLQELVDYPTVSFEGMTVKDVSLFESTVEFNFKISNPNPLGFMITNITYNLFINRKKFIKGVSDREIKINPGDSSIIELPVTFNHLDLFDSIEQFMKFDTAYYELTGEITVGPFHLPYQTSGVLNVPRLPKLSLENIQITDITPSGAKLLLIIGFDNTNPFSVRINELEYLLSLNGNVVFKEKNSHIPLIGKNKKTQVEIPINLNFKEIGYAVSQVLTKPSVDYEFKGNINYQISKIGEKAFPFQQNGTIRLDRR